MKKGKIIFFYIFLILTIINTVLMYINTPIINIDAMAMFGLTLVALVLSALFTFIAAMSNRRFTKKFMLRLQLILLIILVIASFRSRVIELIFGNFDMYLVWRVCATVLYFIVFLFTVGLSRDVFKQLLAIFENRNN